MNKTVTDLSPETLDVLTKYDWPGNIRELRNVIERAIVGAKGNRIEVDNLFFTFPSQMPSPEGDSLEEVEKAHIKKILDQTGWNISRTAKIIKIDRVTLYNKIEKYGLQKQI